MKKLILFVIILNNFLCLLAQQIQNVTATQHGKNIVISYDLINTSAEYDVALYCSTDAGDTFGSPLSALTGDIGKNISSGNNKQIYWNVLADREGLSSSSVVFEVRSRPTNILISDPNIEMVLVKGGSFLMGSSDGEDDEQPIHEVILNDFYIGKFEVTQKQWKQVMGSVPSELNFKGCDNCPVEGVSWYDVQEFIETLNKITGKSFRLPTEAEWEYAARSGPLQKHGITLKYAGSNNIDESAWYNNNSGNKTHPVGQKKPNELGIFDLTGNVWEWCNDWKGNYSSTSQTNPVGPTLGDYRILRGGSWLSQPLRCSVFNRDNSAPAYRDSGIGFRICVTF